MLFLVAYALGSTLGDAGPAVQVVDGDTELFTMGVPEPSTTTVVLPGGTWEFIGHQTFSVGELSPAPRGEEVDLLSEPWGLERAREHMVRIDSNGHRWRWVGPGSGESRLIVDEGKIESGVDVPAINSGGYEADTDGVLAERTWYTRDCDGGFPPKSQHSIWDNEDRVATSYGFRAQRANVYIELKALVNGQSVWGGQCSGTMVADDYLVTAAHCLIDQNGNLPHPEFIVVCARGNDASEGVNAQCTLADSYVINPGYNVGGSGFQPNQDYAVVRLPQAIVGANDTMGLSSASPSTWENFYTRNVAFPGFIPGFVPVSTPSCNSNSVATQQASIFSPAFNMTHQLFAGTQYRGARFELFWSSNRIRTRLDGAVGQSGSAWFYCPSSEDCDATPFIIGLFTHWSSTSGRHLGPRVDLFKQFVLDNE